MTILRNSFFVVLSFTFLVIGCREYKKKSLTSKYEAPVKANSTTIYFINKLSKEPLYNFRFGRYAAREELPTKIILDRDSFGLISKNYIYINRSIKNREDSVFGYFEKHGFKPKFFFIYPNSGTQTIEIDPNPSEIIVKAIDEEFRNNFDSISMIIIKENDYQKNPKSSDSNLVREDFIFTPNHLSKDLTIFNYYIYLNDNLKIQLKVYNEQKTYTLNYEVKYQPFTTTIIKVF